MIYWQKCRRRPTVVMLNIAPAKRKLTALFNDTKMDRNKQLPWMDKCEPISVASANKKINFENIKTYIQCTKAMTITNLLTPWKKHQTLSVISIQHAFATTTRSIPHITQKLKTTNRPKRLSSTYITPSMICSLKDHVLSTYRIHTLCFIFEREASTWWHSMHHTPWHSKKSCRQIRKDSEPMPWSCFWHCPKIVTMNISTFAMRQIQTSSSPSLIKLTM